VATLKSEDVDFQSSITVKPGKTLAIEAMSTLTKEKEDQLWQLVDLEVVSGTRTLSFTTADGQEQSLEHLGHAVQDISAVAHAYLICRKPSDEARNLVKMLEEVISGKRPKLLFEPAEPSFELSINAVGGGLRVELFVDAGNVETGIYRWDSLGIRFFTTAQNLQSFVDELKADFSV